MVTRRKRVVAALLAAVILAAGWLAWLLGTTVGARWLLAQLSAPPAFTLAVGSVEGRLAGRLQLQQVSIAWPDGAVSVDRLDWHLDPGALFAGSLHWTQLSVRNLRVQLPEQPPEEATDAARLPAPENLIPKLPGWLSLVRFRIDSLVLEQAGVVRGGTETLRVAAAEARLDWDGRSFSVGLPELKIPGGRARAEASFDFRGKLGGLQLELLLDEPRNRVDKAETAWTFSLAGERGVTGEGSLRLSGAGRKLAEVETRLSLLADRLEVQRCRLGFPGQPGGVELTGALLFDAADTVWTVRIVSTGVDLAGWGVPLRFDGRVEAEGVNDAYTGHVDLQHLDSTWGIETLTGDFSGDRRGLSFDRIDGSILRGALSGRADLHWRQQAEARFELRGTGLDVGHLHAALDSNLDLSLRGDWSRSPDKERWSVEVPRLTGTWRTEAVRGGLAAAATDGAVRSASLRIDGDGLLLKASGSPQKKMNFEGRVERLERWWPQIAGSVAARGWVQRRGEGWTGAVDGEAGSLALAGVSVDRLLFQADMPEWMNRVALRMQATGLDYAGAAAQEVTVSLSGGVSRHRASLRVAFPQNEIGAELDGAWDSGVWKGRIEDLHFTDARGAFRLLHPAELAVSGRFLQVRRLELSGDTDERLALDLDVSRSPLVGSGEVAWSLLNLERFAPLTPVALSGVSSGELSFSLSEASEAYARLSSRSQLGLQVDGLNIRNADLQVDGVWDQSGLEMDNLLRFAEGGRVDLRLTSTEKPAGRLPGGGEFTFGWRGLPLASLQPWLPTALSLSGNSSGTVAGSWREGARVSLRFQGGLQGAGVSWREPEGELIASDVEGELQGEWKDDQLALTSRIVLAEEGEFAVAAAIPIASRHPFELYREEPWQVRVDLKGREKGLLAFFLPGLVEETRGSLEVRALAGGTPAAPRFSGSLSLNNAAGTLPALGIRLEEIGVQASLDGDLLRLEKVTVVSGGGSLEGEGNFRLDGWDLAAHEWRLKGNDALLVNLPEIEMTASPDLRGSGTGSTVSVAGAVTVPRLHLRSLLTPGQQPVSSTSDVVIVDSDAPAPKSKDVRLNARVRLDLGDHVLIDMAGVDARLKGGVELSVSEAGKAVASGEIAVAQGSYSGYGLRLPIERGRVLFAASPLDRPSLDILALKTIGDVKAGVKVTGTLRYPVITLYSEPALSDTDILSYIVLGRPLDAENADADVLMLAAGALLSRGESTALQESLQRRLGIDVIQVDAGQGDVTSSVVTIGKYLQPDLYVSLGYSVFNQTNEIRLRYNLGKRWELQSNMGTESGADIYYRIDFE